MKLRPIKTKKLMTEKIAYLQLFLSPSQHSETDFHLWC
ncbi:MAG TPA: hypothetical protein DCR48_06215 [Flavobacteriales bacterium]|nr:hypothetical protein [Flavobacteriales bacterium]